MFPERQMAGQTYFFYGKEFYIFIIIKHSHFNPGECYECYRDKRSI